MIEKSIDKEKKGASVSAGSYGVCVKTCDGSFFPVSYGGPQAPNLEDVCRSLCPNADVALYSFPFGGTIDQAVSINGERYVDLPNSAEIPAVLRFELLLPPQGRKLGADARGGRSQIRARGEDIIVTPEKSAEMASRSSPRRNGPESRRQSRKAAPPAVRTGPAAPTERRRRLQPRAEPRRQRDRHGAERRGGDRQPRGLGHRRRGAQSGTKYGEGQGQTVPRRSAPTASIARCG